MNRILVCTVLACASLGGTQACHAGMVFTTTLSGAAEAPPNASPGTGFALLELDPIAHTFLLDVEFSGLLGSTTAAHIHGPTAVAGAGNAMVATQVPSFIGFPLGVSAGSYTQLFDMTLASTWNPAFITAQGGTVAHAEAAFINAVINGKAYLNIHTNVFPAGEIRGFFEPVPEPSSMALLGSGAIALAGFAIRRRKVKVA